MRPAPNPRKSFWFFLIVFNLIALPALFMAGREITRMREATAEKPLPVYGKLRPFELAEQNGNPFGLQDLKNRLWVANFMFTECPSECPTMNFKMGLLQDPLGKDVSFLSFSVDPQKDTPAVLEGYAKKFKAREGVWYFLTGPKPVIGQILEDCHFASAEDPMMHGLRLVLFDGVGQVRGYYDYSDENLVKKLTRDIRSLKERG